MAGKNWEIAQEAKKA